MDQITVIGNTLPLSKSNRILNNFDDDGKVLSFFIIGFSKESSVKEWIKKIDGRWYITQVWLSDIHSNITDGEELKILWK